MPAITILIVPIRLRSTTRLTTVPIRLQSTDRTIVPLRLRSTDQLIDEPVLDHYHYRRWYRTTTRTDRCPACSQFRFDRCCYARSLPIPCCSCLQLTNTLLPSCSTTIDYYCSTCSTITDNCCFACSTTTYSCCPTCSNNCIQDRQVLRGLSLGAGLLFLRGG